MHYGMIATGNHSYLDSLRDAPPSRNLRILSRTNHEIFVLHNTKTLSHERLREGQDPPLRLLC